MAALAGPSDAMLFDLLKRVLVARIRLDAADVFDEGMHDYCEGEIKLCLSILDALLIQSPSANAILAQRLEAAWRAAITVAGGDTTTSHLICPSLADLDLEKPG